MPERFTLVRPISPKQIAALSDKGWGQKWMEQCVNARTKMSSLLTYMPCICCCISM